MKATNGEVVRAYINQLRWKKPEIKAETYVTTISIPKWIRTYCDQENIKLLELIEAGIVARESSKK